MLHAINFVQKEQRAGANENKLRIPLAIYEKVLPVWWDDEHKERRRRVNLILADMCFENKIAFIDHPNPQETFK